MSGAPSHAPPDGYYGHTRHQLIELLDPIPDRVLEVGCGTGNTLARLRQLGAERVCGIELDPTAAGEAEKKADHVLVGDLEQTELPYARESFSCLILGDVLEHLRDPWTALTRLASALEHGGQVVASVPNVRFYEVSLGLLLLGRWDYGREGILDSTHLRFFTRKSVKRLFHESGLKVLSIGSHRGRKRDLFNRATLSLFSDLLTIQHLVKAVKP